MDARHITGPWFDEIPFSLSVPFVIPALFLFSPISELDCSEPPSSEYVRRMNRMHVGDHGGRKGEWKRAEWIIEEKKREGGAISGVVAGFLHAVR